MSAASDGESLLERLRAPRLEPDRSGEAPDDRALSRILEVATTVPDHGSLRPWRFVVLRGPARERFGDALVAGLYEQQGSDVPDAAVSKMRNKAFAAPACIALIASPHVESNVPVWEQEASTACTGYAIVLAAQAIGLGAIWKSAGTVDAPAVRRFFDLGGHERLLGWVNLGTPAAPRRRPAGAAPLALRDVVSVVEADGARPFPGADS